MASDDWSLTPATLARVAELPTPDVPDPDALGSDALAAIDRGARLGVDSCGICGAPETMPGDDDDAGDAPPSVECARCRAIVYCGEAHMAADARAHARVCDLLAFDADLADVDVPDADARAAAAVKATVAKLKLLGRRTTATLLGPRGYGDEGDDENEAAARAARDEATKPRWRALFKLARSDDAKRKEEKNDGDDDDAKTAATLRRHAELLSAPLSLVVASWLFPVVKYALMLGVGGEGRAEEDETAAADKELTPAVVHVVRGSGGDWCEAAADAMWLVGYGAALEKPGVEVTVVAPDLPEGWHRARRSVGGDERGTRSVSFHRGRYDDFAGDATGGTKEGGDASPASTGPCLVFALDLCEALDECEADGDGEEGNEGGGGGWMRSVRAAGCPVLTANRNQFELAAERERMEDELGYVLVGMARNPFPCPVPRQSPASANEVHRRNEWLATYVPASLTNPVSDELEQRGVAPGKRSAGDDESGDRGDGGGEKRARR